jgi:ribosomal protein S18 acetylase RimI-like enzyme
MSEAKTGANSVHIERLRPEEIPELAELAAKTFSDAFGQEMDPDDLKRSLEENRSIPYFERSMDTSKIMVAKQQGKIVGYVQYGSVLIPEANASPEDREIGRLYVDTDLQGRGIGRQLMDLALADPEVTAAPNVFLQVWDQNHGAIALYESYGFETSGVTQFELAGKPAQDLIMVRHQHPENVG